MKFEEIQDDFTLFQNEMRAQMMFNENRPSWTLPENFKSVYSHFISAFMDFGNAINNSDDPLQVRRHGVNLANYGFILSDMFEVKLKIEMEEKST